MSEDLAAPTKRFTSCASDYAVGRPSYPDEATAAIFDGLAPPQALTVVDLGAGTGISSRLIAALGANVIALEPNAAMREKAEPLANVTWQDGTAENTGLPDGSVDVVTAFQAFHWFDFAATFREIERIVRPGGRAAAVYNERGESDSFTAAYGEIVRRFAKDRTEGRRAAAKAAFEAYSGWTGVRIVNIPNEQRLDRDGLHARTRSSSYLPSEGPAAEEMHAEVDALFDRFSRAGMVTIVMNTSVSIGDVGRPASGMR